MTFEEWFKETYKDTYDNPEMKPVHDYWREFTSKVWNAAIHEAIRQSTLPCRSGDAGRDRLPDDLSKLLTA